MQAAIYCDGSAVWTVIPTYDGKTTDMFGQEMGPSPFYFPAGSSYVVQCLTAIGVAGDVSSVVANGFCSKSVSFGTKTTICAYGKCTADLECPLLPTTLEQNQMIADCERLL